MRAPFFCDPHAICIENGFPPATLGPRGGVDDTTMGRFPVAGREAEDGEHG